MDTPRPQTRRSPRRHELEAWRALVETTGELRTELAVRMRTQSGLSPGDYEVLLALSEAPQRRLRSSALAAAIGWERSRLSHHLGRMESRDLVRREECATDNRGAEVVLTATGADAFRRSSAPHLWDVRELFVDALTPAQLESVREISDALRAHLRARTR